LLNEGLRQLLSDRKGRRNLDRAVDAAGHTRPFVGRPPFQRSSPEHSSHSAGNAVKRLKALAGRRSDRARGFHRTRLLGMSAERGRRRAHQAVPGFGRGVGTTLGSQLAHAPGASPQHIDVGYPSVHQDGYHLPTKQIVNLLRICGMLLDGVSGRGAQVPRPSLFWNALR
jgi:hypothetical protein